MYGIVQPVYDAPATSPDQRRPLADPVVAAGLVMVLAAVAFRAWALYPSWFYLDDYNLLLTAKDTAVPSLSYLVEPYNSHLMPGGRLLAWVVASSGQLSWGVAATILLGLQTLAGAAGLWMLTVLFGRRWAILAPLALYLASAMTLPAMMWWTAGLNQVPLQVAFFLAVGAWVQYLRSRRHAWLAGTMLALVIGLCFYVKTLLVFPVLAYLAVAYFTSGSVRQRVRTLFHDYWPALVSATVLAVAYLGYYTTHTSEPFTGTSAGLVGRIADSMLGTAFATALVGGPWDWKVTAPPNAFADPPGWTVHLAWIVVAVTVLVAALTRRGTLRAWVLLAIHLAGLLALLVTSRAPVYGRIIGLEYRYLTDAACAVALCLGLAFLTLRGAPGSSRRREQPLLVIAWPQWLVPATVCLVVASSIFSSVRYVHHWHDENASDAYLHTLARSLKDQGAVDLVDQALPDDVIPAIFAPANSVRRLLPLVENGARFPLTSPRLAVVGPSGLLHRALVEPGVVSEDGPRRRCGWPVRSAGRDVPLTGRAFPWQWWLQIGYLSSADSPVTVSAGGSRIDTEVQSGLNTLYVMLDATFDEVRIDGLDEGVTLCVDSIIVGQPVPGEVLE